MAVDDKYYDGSRIFNSVAAYTGVSVDQVNFVISQFVALGLASLFRTLLHPSKTHRAARHGFGLFFGLIIGYFCFGMQAVHLAGLPALCYIVIRTQSPKTVQRMVLAVALIYLSSIHLYRLWFDYGSYTLDITGPLMVITQKVTSLAFSIHDGCARKDSELTTSQKRYAIYRLPSTLEYFSYVLHFPALMAGPVFFYNDYMDFIDGKTFIQNSKPLGSLNNNSNTVVLEPCPRLTVFKKVSMSLICAFIFVKFLPLYSIQHVKDDEFVKNTSLVYKFWYLYIATFLVRCKYYFAWLLGDAICNNSGLGFNGYADDGSPRWDLIANIDIIKFEKFSTKMHLFIAFMFLNICSSYKIINENNDNTNTDVVEYVLLNEENPCARSCIKGASPMVCRYHFKVEWYQTLSKACFDCPYNMTDCFRPHCISGGGLKRSIVTINRQMPGPSIEVCFGDEVIVDVENALIAESTAIHWHGLHQRGTPYMDGTPYVTQCPIQTGNIFRYHFLAFNAGTHFWHSHLGFQRADGAFGSFIVRYPEESDPHCDLYDYDLSSHVVIVQDWGSEIGLTKFIAHHHSDGDNKPNSILVNGFGKFNEFSDDNNNTIHTPLAKFVVERGYRYRFRVINAGFLNCPIEISVDNHTLTVISSDGNDFKPFEVESIVTYAGERFDFVLKADQPKNNYWIRFRGLMDCDQRFKSVHQVAVLQYYGSADANYSEDEITYEKAHKDGLQLNALNKGVESNGSLSMPQLVSLEEWDISLQEQPDFQYYISYDFYKIDNPHFHEPQHYGFYNVTDKKQRLLTPQLNHISMKLPPFPLLSSRDYVTDSMFCNESTVSGCEGKYCECTHVIQVPLNAVVELVLVDKGFAFDANHPFHLHGHVFRVVAMERVGSNVTIEEVKKLDALHKIKRNLENPPKKDTVTVPDGGYTILRFVASNPGYWLFHCHIEFHVEVGMALVFKVGQHEEMPPVPKNFPQCHHYVPDARLSNCDSSIFSIRHWIPKLFNDNCHSSSSKLLPHITLPFTLILTKILFQ